MPSDFADTPRHEDRHPRRQRAGRHAARARVRRRRPRGRRAEPRAARPAPVADGSVGRRTLGAVGGGDRRGRRRHQPRRPQRQLPVQRREPAGRSSTRGSTRRARSARRSPSAARPPRVWLQASTATIYAHRYDAPNDEATGILGGDEPGAPDTWRFSIDVATAWEQRAERGRHAARRARCCCARR